MTQQSQRMVQPTVFGAKVQGHAASTLIFRLATTHGIICLASGLVFGKGQVIRGQSSANHSPTKRVDDAPTHMEGITNVRRQASLPLY